MKSKKPASTSKQNLSTGTSTNVSQAAITPQQLFDSVKSFDNPDLLSPSPKGQSPRSAYRPALKTIAVIDLSANLPNSPAGTQLDIAMKSFSGMTLLEWCVRRLSESTLLDYTIVTGLPSYQPQVQAAGLCGARWMPSLENESVDRIAQIADRTTATWLAIISPNCPFFDAALLDRLIASAWSHPEADYLSYTSAKNQNIDWGRFGLSCEVLHGRMLKSAKENKVESSRGLSGMVQSYPNLFQPRHVPLPDLLDRTDLTFALETSADWDLAYSYLEAAGDDMSWQRLVEMAMMQH